MGFIDILFCDDDDGDSFVEDDAEDSKSFTLFVAERSLLSSISDDDEPDDVGDDDVEGEDANDDDTVAVNDVRDEFVNGFGDDRLFANFSITSKFNDRRF